MRMVVCDMIQRPRELARGRERGFSAGEGRVSRKVGRASRDRDGQRAEVGVALKRAVQRDNMIYRAQGSGVAGIDIHSIAQT